MKLKSKHLAINFFVERMKMIEDGKIPEPKRARYKKNLLKAITAAGFRQKHFWNYYNQHQ